ncbi:MAG: DUF721 domain-containing protein, partial [Methylocella sp.]
FGWRCVSRLLLKQGPVAALPLARHAPPLDKAAEMAAETITRGIMDEALRQALTRLGARALAGP